MIEARITHPRGGGVALVLLADAGYAMLECDADGVVTALIVDRSTGAETEAAAWEVDTVGLGESLRRIKEFFEQSKT